MTTAKRGLRLGVCGAVLGAVYLGLAPSAMAWNEPLWVQQLGTKDYESADGVATDGDGNVYIAGSTSGSLGGRNQGAWDVFLAQYSPEGALRWKQQFGTDGSDLFGGVTTDGDGNVYIAGFSNSAFVAKYSTAGGLRWRRQLEGYDEANGVATDGDGNVYIAGSGKTDVSGRIAWAAKYSAAGTLLWIRELGWISEFDSGATSAATDRDGNVYIAGWHWTTLDGNSNGWVAKYSAAGVFRWKRHFRTSDYDDASGVATDGDGNVYVVGNTNGDAFIAKYSGAGVFRWRRQLVDGYYADGVATDHDDNVYIAGWTSGSVGGTNQGGIDAYVVKYSATGALRWKRQLGTSEGEGARGVATDGAGSLYIAGDATGSLGGAYYGEVDAWVAKYSTQR